MVATSLASENESRAAVQNASEGCWDCISNLIFRIVIGYHWMKLGMCFQSDGSHVYQKHE